MTVGEVIREACREAGLRQVDVALACDVGQTAVSDWMLGRYAPGLSQIVVIEDLCGLERGVILERAGYAQPMAVVPAIRRDRKLTAEQKRLLIEAYYTYVDVDVEPDMSRADVRAIMAIERVPLRARKRLVAELQGEALQTDTDHPEQLGLDQVARRRIG